MIVSIIIDNVFKNIKKIVKKNDNDRLVITENVLESDGRYENSTKRIE